MDRSEVPGLAVTRKRAGFTQAKLAEAMGVSEITVARWEVGTRSPSLRMLAKIAATLGVQSVDLLGLLSSSPYQEQVTNAVTEEDA